jgi:hypothetical protein
VAIGLPAYNGEAHIQEAIDCILGQTHEDLRLFVVDDASSDATFELARERGRRDRRVHVERNSRRVGLVGNWRHSYARARELCPEAPYFAWASDHDLHDERWLESLVRALDRRPQAAFAYCKHRWQRADGSRYGADDRWPKLDSEPGPGRRLGAVLSHHHCGAMVYGLFRAEALDRSAGIRRVIGPDRLLLSELIARSEATFIDEELWTRRFPGLTSRARQRGAIFPHGAPVRTYLNPHLVHGLLLCRRLIILPGLPATDRMRGVGVCARFVAASGRGAGRKRGRHLVKRTRRTRKRAARVRKRWRARTRHARQQVAGRIGTPDRSGHATLHPMEHSSPPQAVALVNQQPSQLPAP